MRICRFKTIFARRRREMSRIVTLTTDYSEQDAYVGAMKGVILSLCRDATMVDITHDIRPQDVFHAAFIIKSVYRWYPEETVHVAVVDPGVGSSRRRVAMQCGKHFFVGPDNGVFSYVMRELGVVECVELPAPSAAERFGGATFDGRDVFAPAASRIACNSPLSELGSPIVDPVMLDLPVPKTEDSHISGRIIYVDHFGNCISNIERPDIQLEDRPAVVSVGGLPVGPIRQTYTDVPENELLALVNSMGHLEVAMNHGNASEELNCDVGSKVDVKFI